MDASQDPARRQRLHRSLLAWYARARRDLPWRRTQDPYAIWLSEIMLQQTRVDTVIPYYAAFLRRFPTVRALAEAPVDDVLERWSGLGYYRRARALHRAAQQVVHDGGRLPATREGWKRLPGVGDYTAAAVASIAHGEPAAVVDGNVLRVMSRWFSVDDPVDATKGRKRIDGLAAWMVHPAEPGDWNQAVMELGATVCTPASPACSTCPVAGLCDSAGPAALERPRTGGRAAPRQRSLSAVVCESDGGILLAKRAAEGLFGGLWEPPMVEAVAPRAARKAFSGLGLELAGVRLREVGHVRHVLSHFELDVRVLRLAAPGIASTVAPVDGWSQYTTWKYVPKTLGGVAVSTLARKVLSAARLAP